MHPLISVLLWFSIKTAKKQNYSKLRHSYSRIRKGIAEEITKRRRDGVDALGGWGGVGGKRAASAESAGGVQLRQAAAVREGTVEALWAA